MKNIKNLTNSLAFLLILAVFLASCGEENNPMNGNNNPPISGDSLVFSLNELGVSGSGFLRNDTFPHLNFTLGDTIRLTFRIESNCTALDSPYVNVVIDTTEYDFLNNNMPAFNSSFEYFIVITNPSYMQTFTVFFSAQTNRYLRLKDIKIYITK